MSMKPGLKKIPEAVKEATPAAGVLVTVVAAGMAVTEAGRAVAGVDTKAVAIPGVAEAVVVEDREGEDEPGVCIKKSWFFLF